MIPRSSPDRRPFLQRAGLAAALFPVPGAFPAELLRTPTRTEVPFSPDHLPLDSDNDLFIVHHPLTPAIGEVTYPSERILDSRGAPVHDATVEIWHCDHNGAYLHRHSRNADKRDRNSQGFGRFLTGISGDYLVRPITPDAYTGNCLPAYRLQDQGEGT
jgi:protocatechuate 3,4-dioxygenase beta subunit